MEFDVVKKAQHYNSHPSGVEAIEIVRYLDFDLGNCFKYVFRREGKEPVRSLKSALYYLDDFATNLEGDFRGVPQDVVPYWMKVVMSEPDPTAARFYFAMFGYVSYPNHATYQLVRRELLQLIAEAEHAHVGRT